MPTDIQYVEDAPVRVDPQEVLRLQGYQAGVAPRDDVRNLVESQIETGRRLARPRAVFRLWPAHVVSESRLDLAGRELSIGSVVKEWSRIEYLGLSACTIGPALESEVSRLFGDGEYAAGLVLDGVGSVAVESLADHVNELMAQQASQEGLTTACRISPGYGDWPVTEQKAVFDLLPASGIGVTLSESCMMTPRKSISFAVAAGPGFSGGGDGSRCRYCGMTACPYRRA